ncbi:MAG: hypothetical protein QOI50_5558 [Pseudonocardiales bacterium]|uniref:hypothetical protein n=1 Tax=Pseudonocardia sp. Cha107L01 TaxID=3457576 RepID=UPI0028CB05E6|nr:hypothetical protein [Pseudonocardia sp.]MDT7559170.1 hypothetical protein [Pseudonocardiales bacterium]MDT7562320.1 hypothetical protein [Pseudonocardiales bacterium]MDT7586792.1 hypothetical protein [Pseudonocardiales bacterium]MDT7605570.1 hypothetical protein [Pseudonocardiales bacterium]
MTGSREDQRVGVVSSEFAAVELSIDNAANGPRLRIEDLRGNRVAYLDALQLESLAWLPTDRLNALLDPYASRGDGPQPAED